MMRTLAAAAALSMTIWVLVPQAKADGEESGSSTASDVVQSAENIGKAVVEGAKTFGGNIVKHVIRGATRVATGGSTSTSSKSARSTASDVVQSAKNIGGALVEGARKVGGNILKHLGQAAAKRSSASTRGASLQKPGKLSTRTPRRALRVVGRPTSSRLRKRKRALRGRAPVAARRKKTSRR